MQPLSRTRLALLRARVVFAGALALALTCGLAHGAPVDTNPPAGWWRDATFYEIFVRSFADAKTGKLAGDGIGDLEGLIEHLDYLNDGHGAAGSSLGINAVWLMPIQPSPSYHGYDVTDYFAVNPQYGDVDLMKRFVAEAHRRGIRVIIDLVLNHCSSQHPLFRDAVSGDPARAGRARPQFRFAPVPEQLYGPWGERVWHPENDEFYYGVFSSEMPDWNFHDAAVTDHHRRCAEFWLRDVGVDGFRLDAVPYFYEDGDRMQDAPETRQWLRDFTAYCHTIKPGAFVVGEDSANMRNVAAYIRGRSLDSAFEFDLAKATVEAIQLRTPGILMRAVQTLETLYDGDAAWSTFLSNHDQERIFSQLGSDPGKARLAAKLLFTFPGVPFIYYGEELGEAGRKPDPELRTPMHWTGDEPNAGFTSADVKPWHVITGDPAQVNVASESADRDSLLALYRRLIRLNASSPALRHGAPLNVTTSDRHVYATMRQTPDEAVLVLANFDPEPKRGPAVSVEKSGVRPNWVAHEEIEQATIAPGAWNADGGFSNWLPIAELAPESLYVIQWRRE
jgi:glycosidase